MEFDRKAMYKLSYGLFVCTAVRDGRANGCIINTAIQAASTPNCISIAVNKENYTHDMILETGRCNLSVISTEADFALFERFGFHSGRDTDKFADLPAEAWTAAENGIPVILAGTNACFSLKVEQTVDLGSHTVFFCTPEHMAVLSGAPSCTYEYYQNNIKQKPGAGNAGAAPAAVPAAAADAAAADSAPAGSAPAGRTVWRCTVCGYEYEGEELPEGFICPWCKHPAEDFEKVQGA